MCILVLVLVLEADIRGVQLARPRPSPRRHSRHKDASIKVVFSSAETNETSSTIPKYEREHESVVHELQGHSVQRIPRNWLWLSCTS